MYINFNIIELTKQKQEIIIIALSVKITLMWWQDTVEFDREKYKIVDQTKLKGILTKSLLL